MKRLRWKALLRIEEIPVVFLLIQLGLGGWEKRGRSIPVPLCSINAGGTCPDIDLITPYCTRIPVYDYAFLFTVFFLITVLLLWKTRKKSLLLELVYWLVVSLYAWSAWFTEFQDLSRNSLLYLAVLRWLTLTFFRDPINFCGFLLLAGVGLKSLFTSLRAVSGG